MEFIEECLKAPVAGSCDGIVAGGGPAGVPAAIAAAAWALKHETDVRDVKIKEIMKGF